jgi:hypothetical protein
MTEYLHGNLKRGAAHGKNSMEDGPYHHFYTNAKINEN